MGDISNLDNIKKLTILISSQDYFFLHFPSKKSGCLVEIFIFLYLNDVVNLV